MTDKYITKEKLIQLLDDAIENEIQKPTEETDMEFVTECEHLINALMGNEHEYTNEDAERYFAEIMKKKNVKKNTIFIQSKRVIAASIAVFIILGGITLYAFNPTVRDLILKTLNLEIGQTISEGGVTYEYKGKSTSYNTIEELLKEKNLNIVYPTQCAYDAQITRIIRTESNDITIFNFSNATIELIISHNSTISTSIFENAEIVSNNYTFFITSKSEHYTAYTIINGDLYTIKCDTKENLLLMINSFN